MNELIKIEERGGIQTVNARDLWIGLESKRQFGNWIVERLVDFTEGKDFTINRIVKVQIEGGREVNRPVIDYYLTIDTAKHLAMLERNDKGREIRQYFIDIENRARQNTDTLTGPELLAVAVIEAQRMLQAKDAHIAKLEPKAAVADRIAIAEGLRTISDIGKINGLGPLKIFAILERQNIIYRGTDSRWRPYQAYIDSGYFRVVDATYETGHGFHLTVQTYVTGRGEVWLARRLFAERIA